MKYATLLTCLLAVTWAGPPMASAQDDEDAPPVIESITWQRIVDLDGLLGGGLGNSTSFIPSTDTAYEADVLRAEITITDADWAFDDEEEDEGVFIRLTSYWVPFGNYLTPEPPPISAASEEWYPEDDGFGPNTTLNGRPALVLIYTLRVPEFQGKNQARLRGVTVPTNDVAYGFRSIVDWDVRWRIQFQVTNDTGDDGIIQARSQYIYAIEHPAAGPGNPQPFADAGPDQNVVVGTNVKLDASATFDGYNSGFDPQLADVIDKDTLSYTWEWISGPAYVEPTQIHVGDPVATVQLNVASDATAGTLIPYIFRVLVHDNVNPLPTSDTVQILVFTEMPPNEAPKAIITGPETPVAVGDTVTLSGAASYDPEGSDLEYRWVQTDELGNSITVDDLDRFFQPISGVQSDVVTWQATEAGTYYFRLIVNDGELEGDDEFVVFINEAANSQVSGTIIRLSEEEAAKVTGETLQSNNNDDVTTALPLIPACGGSLVPLTAVPAALLLMRRRDA